MTLTGPQNAGLDERGEYSNLLWPTPAVPWVAAPPGIVSKWSFCRRGLHEDAAEVSGPMTEWVCWIRPTTVWEWRQLLAYAGLLALALVLATVALFANAALFEPLIGEMNPVAAAAGIGLLGAALLYVLRARDGFLIVRPAVAPGLRRAAGLASLFGLLIIGVDSAMVHPADMNVPFPQSLLFYPVISLMVEILFHLLPLTALLTVVPMMARHRQSETTVQASLLLVALLEPAYQTWAAVTETPIVGAPASYAASTVTYDALHIFAINLCQLQVFRRYDFVSMYAFRFVYYAIWHIVWGHIRLGVLF
jgi:hypothetical protein